ncbi:hypothetical protein AHIS2_p046 [Acaryochloris phage A-HIS2]|nr:hypothetical protein AHIS2_p046 [Acaryochloris phage A-HIS2]
MVIPEVTGKFLMENTGSISKPLDNFGNLSVILGSYHGGQRHGQPNR